MRKIAVAGAFGLVVFCCGQPQNAHAQTVNSWTVPIHVQTGNNGYDLYLGISPNATDGFDFGIDTVAAPPPPATPYAYFPLATFPNFLQADFRGMSNATFWSLRIVNTNGATSTVSWNVSQVPSSVPALFIVSQKDTVNMLRTATKIYVGDQNLKISFPTPVSVISRPTEMVLESFDLKSYPNPFATTMMFEVNLPTSRPVTVRLFNLVGQEIRTFVQHHPVPSPLRIQWDGRDAAGVSVPNGVYFCRLEAEGIRLERKLFRIR